MEQQAARFEAKTLAVMNRLEAEVEWTSEEFDRLVERRGDNKEPAYAHLGSTAEENAAKEEEERKRETVVRAEELKARIRENFARMRESEAGLEG
jgi:hypothetical protein